MIYDIYYYDDDDACIIIYNGERCLIGGFNNLLHFVISKDWNYDDEKEAVVGPVLFQKLPSHKKNF